MLLKYWPRSNIPFGEFSLFQAILDIKYSENVIFMVFQGILRNSFIFFFFKIAGFFKLRQGKRTKNRDCLAKLRNFRLPPIQIRPVRLSTGKFSVRLMRA